MSTSKRPISARFALFAWALAALLAACGPGVGGTGTGEPSSALQPGAATPASVCSGDLAALLGCAGSGAAAVPLLALDLVDTLDGRQVRVHLQGDEVELSVPCARLTFSGHWGTVEGRPAAYFGTATVDGAPAPATLSVQRVDGGVMLELRDAQGGTLLAPLVVVVVATPEPAACN